MNHNKHLFPDHWALMVTMATHTIEPPSQLQIPRIDDIETAIRAQLREDMATMEREANETETEEEIEAEE